MQPALIFTLIALGCVAKLGVLWRLVSCRLVARLPFFSAMVALSLAGSALSLTGHLHPYNEFWTATRWPMAILEAGAALEAFWRVAEHFRNMRGFGMVLLGVMCGFAIAVAVAVGALRTYWNDPLSGALLFSQSTHLGLLVLTLLSAAFFWQFSGVPIRPNATRHLLALTVLFGSLFLGYFFGQASRGQWRFLTNLSINLGSDIAYTWWAIRTTRDGERLPFSKPQPLSIDEFAAAEAADERDAREIRRASAKALSKVLRP